jgi:hypothetical protein
MHTDVAIKHGASREEIAEALSMAVSVNAGAAVGTGFYFLGSGFNLAVVAMITSFVVISLIHAALRRFRSASYGSLVPSSDGTSFHRRCRRLSDRNKECLLGRPEYPKSLLDCVRWSRVTIKRMPERDRNPTATRTSKVAV